MINLLRNDKENNFWKNLLQEEIESVYRIDFSIESLENKALVYRKMGELEEAFKTQTGTTFYTQLKSVLGSIEKNIGDNCLKEKISEQFPKGTYEYQNRDDVINYDMNSLKF